MPKISAELFPSSALSDKLSIAAAEMDLELALTNGTAGEGNGEETCLLKTEVFVEAIGQITSRSLSLKSRIESLESDLRQSTHGRDEEAGILRVRLAKATQSVHSS